MFRNTTVMVWYICVLMTVAAALGNGGILNAQGSMKANALEYWASPSRGTTANEAGRTVRIIIDGIEYNAKLIGPAESVQPSIISY